MYDVKTGKTIFPKIPSTAGSQLVAMPTQNPAITVRTNAQIRTWQLPHSPLAGVLIPCRVQAARNRGSFSFQRLMTIRLSGARARARAVSLQDFVKQQKGVLAFNDQGQLLLAQKTNDGNGPIQVQRWERKSGRLQSTFDLPSAANEMVGPFDPQGQFLLTGSIVEDETRKARIQVWNAATGTRHGEAFILPEDTVPMAVSPDGNSVLIAKSQRDNNAPPRRRGRDNNAPPGRRGRDIGFGIRASWGLSVLNLKTNDARSLAKSQTGFATGRFSADGRYVIFGTKGNLRRHDLQNNATEAFSAHEAETFQSQGLWTSSSDGRSIASTDGGSTVFLQRFVAKTEFGGIDSAAIELKHPAAITSMAFDPKGGVFVTAASDGIVRQWALPEKWNGEAADIRTRIERHTGLSLTSAGDVVASEQVADGADNGEVSSSDANTLSDLTDEQLGSIRLRNAEEWEDAEAALAAWSAEQPQDWRPDVLRLRSLVQLGRMDEADAAWNRAVNRIGNDAAFAWLVVDAERHSALLERNQNSGLRGARYNNADPESASNTAWYSRRLLERAPNDSTKAGLLLQMAKALELEVKLDEAADAINKAVALQPDSADIHYYRAHLMERLNRWDEALLSRQKLVLLEPEHRDAHYRVVASHLFSGNNEAAVDSWAKFLSDKAESLEQDGVVNAQIRDRVAKSRFVANGSKDDGLNKALAFADTNFADDGTNRTLKPWITLTKGIAEYRRGQDDNLAEAIEHLDAAKKMLTDFPALGISNFSRGVAITRFFAAMAHYKLGRSDVARETYLDGLDRHSRDEDQLRISSTQTWADWQLAEVARREAAALLKIDEKSIDQPVPDTSQWKVLLEEDFDDGLSDDWKQITGKWTVVDGVACGMLEQPQGAVNSAYGRLEHEIADLPTTFEVEYEVWTSAPMLAACFLRKSGPPKPPYGHRVALASYPDYQFTNQGKPGKGVNLVAQAEFGHWVEGAANDFEVNPNQHYKVRIIRQPQRITVFIDGNEVMSHRVRDIETKTIRFFARGEVGTKMFIDDVRLRIPAHIVRDEN